MEFIRIGEKLISRGKIIDAVDQILVQRSQGNSQQDVAKSLGVDRSFVSRLESLGEIRKGRKIGLVGFPVSNKEELTQLAQEAGVDYVLLLTDEERWGFVRKNSGIDLFNEVMQIVAQVRACDTVLFLGSNKRLALVRALLDSEVIGIELGESPIEEDKYVAPNKVRSVLQHLKANGERRDRGEEGCQR